MPTGGEIDELRRLEFDNGSRRDGFKAMQTLQRLTGLLCNQPTYAVRGGAESSRLKKDGERSKQKAGLRPTTFLKLLEADAQVDFPRDRLRAEKAFLAERGPIIESLDYLRRSLITATEVEKIGGEPLLAHLQARGRRRPFQWSPDAYIRLFHLRDAAGVGPFALARRVHLDCTILRDSTLCGPLQVQYEQLSARARSPSVFASNALLLRLEVCDLLSSRDRPLRVDHVGVPGTQWLPLTASEQELRQSLGCDLRVDPGESYRDGVSRVAFGGDVKFVLEGRWIQPGAVEYLAWNTAPMWIPGALSTHDRVRFALLARGAFPAGGDVASVAFPLNGLLVDHLTVTVRFIGEPHECPVSVEFKAYPSIRSRLCATDEQETDERTIEVTRSNNGLSTCFEFKLPRPVVDWAYSLQWVQPRRGVLPNGDGERTAESSSASAA